MEKPEGSVSEADNNGGYYISPLIPGRGTRSFAQGGKLGWVGGDTDSARPAAGMTSAQLNQRHGKSSKSEIACDCPPPPGGQIPGYTGSILSDGHIPEHICPKKDVPAGISTMELCPDEHEHECIAPPVPAVKVRDTVSDILHSHGHPDHVIDLDDSRAGSSDAFQNGHLSAKGKSVIRGGKLVHLAYEVEESPPPAGVASLVHARTTNLNVLAGQPITPDNGVHRDAKVSGHGGRFVLRGGKLIKVAGEEDHNLGAAGVRTGQTHPR